MSVVGADRAAATSPLDPVSLEDARAGLDHLYHGRSGEAVRAFERIRERHPESPAPDFLLGGIEWHALITGPSGFLAGGVAEIAFFRRLDAAIEKGERRLETHPDDLSARFFLGGAYGYKARYLALKEKWWDAYRTGKKGVKHLERVVKADPEFSDAYLGLGIYHYYADVLPSILKFFAGFVGLHGDAGRGREEIHRALREGVLVGAECRFFLAEIYTTFEKKHWPALGFARSLRAEYPENELFTWIHARVLDELHINDAAFDEWELLKTKAHGPQHRGFIDYRLARSSLFAGDFQGAAHRLSAPLAGDGLGSRRMTMWGRLRYGQALDFLGRHTEAMEQYRLAKEMDVSDTAKERATKRLAAGRSDPSTISLEELAELARILKETGGHGEEALLRVEVMVTSPSRGMSRPEKELYFSILEDLAGARLRRGDLEGCVAAIERALAGSPAPPKESRARLIAMRARAHLRAGRVEEAREDLRRARGRAGWDLRKRIDRELGLVGDWGRRGDARLGGAGAAGVSGRDGSVGPPDPFQGDGPPRLPDTGVSITVPNGLFLHAPDRGEILLEVEVSSLPDGPRVACDLVDGRWSVTVPRSPGRDEIRYRYLADGFEIRIDPNVPEVVLDGDEVWSVERFEASVSE